MLCLFFFQDRGVKEDELQSILNYLLTMHEVNANFWVKIDTVREGKRGTERVRAVEWSWLQNVHYNAWAGVMVHLNG